MGVYIWNRLPSEYQEVEWIQSSGTQYIDTGYQPNNNTEVSAKFSLTSLNNSYVYGVRNNQSDASRRAFFMGYDTSLQKFYAQVLNNTNNNQILSLSSPSLNTEYTTLQNNKAFYINGVLQGNYNNQSAFSVGYNMFVFGGKIGDSVGNKMPMKLYYMKISESGTLVRNFIPCYRKSDSVIGLYDLVNSVFYTNSGSGTFTKGSDVNNYYEKVMKNAYIGEYIPNIEYSYDFRSKSTTTLSNDGWTWNNAPSIDSGGIYFNSWSSDCWKELGRTIGDAKKITLEIGIAINGGNYAVGGQIGILNSTLSGFYIDSYPSKQFAINGNNVYDNRNSNNTGTYTIKAVYDLVNKTYNVSSYVSTSGNLTDAQIEAIRTYNSIRCMVANGGSRIQTVNLLVEY